MTNRKLKGEEGKGTMYRIETNSFIKVKPIVDYLTKFELKTKKKEAFKI